MRDAVAEYALILLGIGCAQWHALTGNPVRR